MNAKAKRVISVLSVLISMNCMAATYVDLPLTDVKDHAFDKFGFLYITAGNRLMVYDTNTCTMHERFLADQPLMGVDISRDSAWAALGTTGVTSGRAKIYYMNINHHRHFLDHNYLVQSLESGSYMPAWMHNNQLLFGGTFAGSGWTPLRVLDVDSVSTSAVASVRQNSMLTKSNSKIIAVAEANTSAGPIRAFESGSQQFVASVNLNWFVYDVALNSNGTRFVAPTYNGTYVLDRVGQNLVEVGRIGQYATHGPVGAAFSPDSTKLFTANWSWNTPSQAGLKMLDAQTLAPLANIDGYQFDWSGNGALGEGRLTMDENGQWLAANISNGVRLYDVSADLGSPQPASCATQKANAATDDAIPRRRKGQQIDALGWWVRSAY